MALSEEYRKSLIDTIRSLAPESGQVPRIQHIINAAHPGAWNAEVPAGATVFDGIESVVNAANTQGWIRELVVGLCKEFSNNQALAKVLAALDQAAVDVETSCDDPEAPIHLLRETLARHLGDNAAEISKLLVDKIRKSNGSDISGSELFDATRFAVEYHLLLAEEISPMLLMDVAYGKREDKLDEFRTVLHEALDKRTLRGFELKVEPHRFFSRALEREDDWFAYFNAVRRLCDPNPTIGSTICRIRTDGFVAPQYLIAGLLPHFEDNWCPIIAVYERQMQDSQSAFNSFQASQWNTWLMWGPSIPVCQCTEWSGIHALQYGYGDENNSIPIVGVNDGAPVSFEATRDGYSPKDPQVCAVFRRMTGRLRWAPWLFQRAGLPTVPDTSGEFPLPGLPMSPAARAQRFIYEQDEQGKQRDGLVFQVESFKNGESPRSYFTAYLWLMFLVARRPVEPGKAPRRLAGAYPALDARSFERMPNYLWRELLPVYVHANIADAKALAIHRRALVSNALSLLRRLWTDRAELLPGVVKEELCFWLVGGSDYSGCGSQLRFASGDPLVGLLREQIAAESDREFASAIVLPPDAETTATRPPEIAAFYSTCRLPDLVGDYYEYVYRLKEERSGR